MTVSLIKIDAKADDWDIYMRPAMSLKMGVSLWMSADFQIDGDIDYCH